ncbi:MAG: hypothetical protein HN509_05960 [Halobacteriovoraceae bacterium]|nr:hypothetical protein [Halobacteriovoraceae bacterium]
MENSLGPWAVIDIETTGLNPMDDAIIDVGFLQFEGTKLVRSYESLVGTDHKVSQFIQKLTGIKSSALKKAPAWETVEMEVQELYGHHLLAHNSDFEKKFLKYSFDEVDDGEDREEYCDSIFYLSLLFPNYSSLKLEKFICDWKIAESEQHRGLQDSIDLLKVLLVATRYRKDQKEFAGQFSSLVRKHSLTDWWYYKFFNLYTDELEEIAEQIDFDLEASLLNVKDFFEKEDVSHDEELGEAVEIEFSSENIKNIYGDKELLNKKMPFFRYRKPQEDLSLKTGQAFKNHVHALVQAPTGTGKTLGYLIPSALFSLEEKKQVLISTGTKTLQHQAISKDVPQLRRILGLSEKDLKIKRLIGSGNHLCELLFRQALEEEDLLFDARGFEEKFTDLYFDLLFYYNGQNESPVLRDDLPYLMKIKLEAFAKRSKDLAVDFRACTGQQCPFRNDCSYVKGLREAKDADIIIGNHALMFSWPKNFPRPQYLVVDEAHKIEEETTKAYTFEVTGRDLEGLSNSLKNLQGIGSLFYLLAQNEGVEGESTPVINQIRESAQHIQSVLAEHLQWLPDKIEAYFKRRPRYTDIFWNELPMINPERAQDETAMAIYNHLDSIRHILADFYQTLLPFASRWDAKSFDDDNQIIAFTRFEAFMGGFDDLRAALVVSLDAKEGYSHSLKYHADHGFETSSAPINVGKVLHDGLLETSSSVLYTSATLGNAHGDQGTKGIEWSTGYLYLDPERRFKRGFYLDSPYDFEKNTKVYLCDDMPPFFDKTFVKSTLGHINKLIRDLGGRSLLLFSARSRFEVARELLLKEFEGEIPLFIQGMGNNVVEDFKNSQHGILVGMESFGEGIDIPGETLQFVFIDKIPDMRMEQVIGDRRDFYESNLGNEFTDYYLAHRTRALHQKLGRLIRTENDYGGIIVVDSRIKKWKGRTMQQLVKLMEPYKIERANLVDACSGVREFIEGRNNSNVIPEVTIPDQGHLEI